jgi:hypothetical protein
MFKTEIEINDKDDSIPSPIITPCFGGSNEVVTVLEGVSRTFTTEDSEITKVC